MAPFPLGGGRLPLDQTSRRSPRRMPGPFDDVQGLSTVDFWCIELVIKPSTRRESLTAALAMFDTTSGCHRHPVAESSSWHSPARQGAARSSIRASVPFWELPPPDPPPPAPCNARHRRLGSRTPCASSGPPERRSQGLLTTHERSYPVAGSGQAMPTKTGPRRRSGRS
jgi:hypothetical protein